MNVLLIQPPSLSPLSSNTPSFVDEEGGYYPPLGLLSLAAFGRAHSHHRFAVLDALAEQLTHEQVESRLASSRPDVIGITAMTFTLLDVLRVAESARRTVPEATVVVGGPHAHIYPRETVTQPSVDIVVTGEGELPFVELLDRLESRQALDGLEGVAFTTGGQVRIGEPPEPIAGLDVLPHPARELTDVSKYYSLLGDRAPVTTMFTSRGCPFKCVFCDRPHLGKKFRAHSADYVLEEFEQCAAIGIREILVYDDTFTVNRNRVVDICRGLIERKLDLTWDIRARVDTVDADLLAMLRRAGCRRIHYGVEAGCDEILASLQKGITVARVRAAFRETRKSGIATLAYFMIGSPGESIEQIERTIQFACELKPDYAHFSITTPFPGTGLYRMGLEKGLFGDFWQEFASSPSADFVPRFWEENLTRAQLLELIERAYKKFYTRPSYVIRHLARIRSWQELTRKVKAGLRVLRA